MTTSKSNITFKIYPNGKEFILENEKYLRKDAVSTIETAFFYLNAQGYTHLDKKNYALSFHKEDKVLLLLKLNPVNALIFGSNELCYYAANVVADLNLDVENILGEQNLTTHFLKAYQERRTGQMELVHAMQIMVMEQLKPVDTAGVFQCEPKHLPLLAQCRLEFKQAALNEQTTLEEEANVIQGNEQDYYAYSVDGRIVSIASKTRNFESICGISCVYTVPAYRNKGYSAKVVTKICQDILLENKTPYLFVDNANPISNHLYVKLGFTYLNHQAQYRYNKGNIKTAIFAGGCFWCLADAFYSCKGVKRVVSGFVGGEEILPSYKEVKEGKTHHKEAIMIEYDKNETSYSSLLDIYFSHIDPLDGEGQYIDRGSNYTCAIYSSKDEEIKLAQSYIENLEKQMGQKVYVPLCEESVFYPAEEEHQDF
nr:peptide-methionine (S)-S-oxide reductase MsrA [Anaeroplasmataceae bacterium]